jgi:hypothetical protein
MAIAFDASQGTNQAAAGATTITLTTGAAVASGGLLVVCISANAGTLNTVSDGTNNLTIGTPASSGLEKTWMAYRYYAGGLASSSTITATFAGSQSERMIGAASWTGCDSTPFEVESTRNTIFSETSWTCSPVTNVSAAALIVGFFGTAGAGNPTNTAGVNYTECLDWTLSGGQKSAAAVYRIVSSAAAQTPLGDWSSSQTGAEQSANAMSFEAATGSIPMTLTPVTQTNAAQALSFTQGGTIYEGSWGDMGIEWGLMGIEGETILTTDRRRFVLPPMSP